MVDGKDILCKREDRNNDDDDDEKELVNDVYVGPDGVQWKRTTMRVIVQV